MEAFHLAREREQEEEKRGRGLEGKDERDQEANGAVGSRTCTTCQMVGVTRSLGHRGNCSTMTAQEKAAAVRRRNASGNAIANARRETGTRRTPERVAAVRGRNATANARRAAASKPVCGACVARAGLITARRNRKWKGHKGKCIGGAGRMQNADDWSTFADTEVHDCGSFFDADRQCAFCGALRFEAEMSMPQMCCKKGQIDVPPMMFRRTRGKKRRRSYTFSMVPPPVLRGVLEQSKGIEKHALYHLNGAFAMTYPMNKTATDCKVATGRRDDMSKKAWYDRSVHAFTIFGKHVRGTPPLKAPLGKESRNVQVYFETPADQKKLRFKFLAKNFHPMSGSKPRHVKCRSQLRKLSGKLSAEVLKSNSYAADFQRASAIKGPGVQIVVQADRGKRPKNYESRGMNEFAAIVRGDGPRRFMVRQRKRKDAWAAAQQSNKKTAGGSKNAGADAPPQQKDSDEEEETKETAQEIADREEYKAGIGNPRDLVLSINDTEWNTINSKHRSYDALGYPLLGEADGFALEPVREEKKIRLNARGEFTHLPVATTATTQREFYAHRLAVRPEKSDLERDQRVNTITTAQALKLPPVERQGVIDGVNPYTTLAVDRESYLFNKLKRRKRETTEDAKEAEELRRLSTALSKIEGVVVDPGAAADMNGEDANVRYTKRRLSKAARKKRSQKAAKAFRNTLSMNPAVRARGRFQVSHRKKGGRQPEHYNALHRSGPLFQQYCTDMGAKLLQSDLEYLELPKVQKNKLRADVYKNVVKAVKGKKGNTAGRPVQRKILPASFIGSPRHMRKCYRKAMAMVRKEGKPSLFITMTCNPKWPEIIDACRHMKGGQETRTDIQTRVFKCKLEALMNDLTKKHVLGRSVGHIQVTEWQKRGLPHAHILLVLDRNFRPTTAEDVDRVVKAEFPPNTKENELLRNLVGRHQTHKCKEESCRHDTPQGEPTCAKNFPMAYSPFTNCDGDSYPQYRRRHIPSDVWKPPSAWRNGSTPVHNSNVVPYNPYLLLKYRCHINVEIVTHISAVKYLYKYVYKGHDRVVAKVSRVDGDGEVINEIQGYMDGRYICTSEALWRLFKFRTHADSHSVQELGLYLPGEHAVAFNTDTEAEQIVEQLQKPRTTLEAWFDANKAAGNDAEGVQTRSLLYVDFPEHFTYSQGRDGADASWTRRIKKLRVVGRLHWVDPSHNELYRLRQLLTRVPGATSFRDLLDGQKTFDDAVRFQFPQLLDDDTQWHLLMAEACEWQTAAQMRQLLVRILLLDAPPAKPRALWDKFKSQFTFPRETTDDALYAIERLLQEASGKTLADFKLPKPSTCKTEAVPYLVHVERPSRTERATATDYMNDNYPLCDYHQKNAFDTIIAGVDDPTKGNVHFISAPAGTGKTFLNKLLLNACRAKGQVALATAYAGIAALLMPGGRTSHYRFMLPLGAVEGSQCGYTGTGLTEKIKTQTSKSSAERRQVHKKAKCRVLQEASIIIWDEITMANEFEITVRQQRQPCTKATVDGGI